HSLHLPHPAPTHIYTLSLHDALPICFGQQTTDEMLYGFLGVTSTTSPWSEVRFRAAPPLKKGQKPRDPLAILKKRVGTWETETVDRKSTRLNSSHVAISYAVFCLKKK